MSRKRNVTLRRLRRFFLRHVSEQAFAVAKYVHGLAPSGGVSYGDDDGADQNETYVTIIVPYRHRPHRQAFWISFKSAYVEFYRVHGLAVQVEYGAPDLFDRLGELVEEYLRG